MRRGPSPLFPSPSTFAALLKTFQQALVPSRVPHVVGGGAQSAATAAFAATVVPRRARSLADAIDAAAARVLSRLNGLEDDGPVTLALLTVSPAYGSAATAAPAVLASALGCRVVIGGVSDGPGVTLWAARLPGITATPFISYGGSLPSLDNDAWAKLAAGGSDDMSTGALILGRSPSVGTLAGRLSVALPPAAAIVGGVLGNATPTTPLFINDGVAPADAAAVGVLLRGQGARLIGVAGDKAAAVGAQTAPSSTIVLAPPGTPPPASQPTGPPPSTPSTPPSTPSTPPPPSTFIACDAVTVSGAPASFGTLVFS